MKHLVNTSLSVAGARFTVLFICLVGCGSSLLASAGRKVKSIKEFDYALAAYYLSIGQTDYRSAADGMGKFEFFCEENGFEFEDLEEELAQSPNECTLVEFDDNFPGIQESSGKIKKIHMILKNIFTTGTSGVRDAHLASLNPMLSDGWEDTLLDDASNITEKNYKALRKRMKDQIPDHTYCCISNHCELLRSLLESHVTGHPILSFAIDYFSLQNALHAGTVYRKERVGKLGFFRGKAARYPSRTKEFIDSIDCAKGAVILHHQMIPYWRVSITMKELKSLLAEAVRAATNLDPQHSFHYEVVFNIILDSFNASKPAYQGTPYDTDDETDDDDTDDEEDDIAEEDQNIDTQIGKALSSNSGFIRILDATELLEKIIGSDAADIVMKYDGGHNITLSYPLGGNIFNSYFKNDAEVKKLSISGLFRSYAHVSLRDSDVIIPEVVGVLVLKYADLDESFALSLPDREFSAFMDTIDQFKFYSEKGKKEFADNGMNILMRAKLNSLVKSSGGINKKRFQLLLDKRDGKSNLIAHNAVDTTIPDDPVEIYHTTVVHNSILGDIGSKDHCAGKIVTVQIVIDHGIVRVYLNKSAQRTRVFVPTLDLIVASIITK